MKHLSFYLLCITFFLVGKAYSNNPYQVSGRLTGVPGDTLVVNYLNFEGGYSEPIETIVLKDGTFGFDTPYTSPTFIFLEPQATKEDGFRQQIPIVVVPGEQVTINGTMNNYIIGGSPFYQSFNDVIIPIVRMNEARTRAIEKKYNAMLAVKDTNRDSISNLEAKEMKVLRDEISNLAIRSMKIHSGEEAAGILLSLVDPTERQNALNLLSERVRNGRMAPYYRSLVTAGE